MRTLLVIVLTCSTSYADRPRYQRAAAVPPAIAPLKAKPASKLEPARPVVTADDVMAAEERQQPLRIEQEKVLEQLVRDTPDSDPDKPELMFRLAEHYARQLRFWQVEQVLRSKR